MLKKYKKFRDDMKWYEKQKEFWFEYLDRYPNDDAAWDCFRQELNETYRKKQNHRIYNFIYNHIDR